MIPGGLLRIVEQNEIAAGIGDRKKRKSVITGHNPVDETEFTAAPVLYRKIGVPER
jgi:hypothetical protein